MTQFYAYRTDGTPDAIRGYIDDVLMLDFPNEDTGPKAWPFDQRFHFLLNVAAGGDWGGEKRRRCQRIPGADAGRLRPGVQTGSGTISRLSLEGGQRNIEGRPCVRLVHPNNRLRMEIGAACMHDGHVAVFGLQCAWQAPIDVCRSAA